MKMNKKGITLVEVIVVLIIMAVLAGILVASYTGYIDKANQDKALVEARAAYLAAMTLYNEDFANNVTGATVSSWTLRDADIKTLAGVTGESSAITVAGGKITVMTYTTTGGYVCALAGGVWTVTKS
jgi:type IV pilus assembly protein PilA